MSSLGQRAAASLLKHAGRRGLSLQRVLSNINRMAAVGDVELSRRNFLVTQLAASIAPTHATLTALDNPRIAAAAKTLVRGANLAGAAITSPTVGPALAANLPKNNLMRMPRYAGYAAGLPLAYTAARYAQTLFAPD